MSWCSFPSPAAPPFSKFKRYLDDYKVDSLICIEFFEPRYIAEWLEMGVPLVFLDLPLAHTPLRGHYDIILPESQVAVTTLCLQLIAALKTMKIHAPKDVKVVGFDNTPETKYSTPP